MLWLNISFVRRLVKDAVTIPHTDGIRLVVTMASPPFVSAGFRIQLRTETGILGDVSITTKRKTEAKPSLCTNENSNRPGK